MSWTGSYRPFVAAPVLASLLGGACADRFLPPVIESITPSLVTNLVVTPAVISGRNFVAFSSAVLDDDTPPVIDRTWRVALGDRELGAGAVAWTSSDELRIEVPQGLTAANYDVTVIAPSGLETTSVGGLRVVSDPVGLPLAIEDAPGGAGHPVGSATLTAGDQVQLYAVARDGRGAFLADVAGTWDVVGGIGSVDAGPASAAIFRARFVGAGLVRVAHPLAAGNGETGSLAVKAAAPARVVIADATDSTATEIGTLGGLSTDDQMTLHAVSQDAFGNYVAAAMVSWSASGGIGSIPAGPSATAILDLQRPGTGKVSILHPALGGDETGDITVAPGRAAILTVSPATATLRIPDTPVVFSATGVDGDGNATLDVGSLAWSVSTGSLQSLDATAGVLTPQAPGTGTVRATSSYGAWGDSGTVTILAPAALRGSFTVPATVSIGESFPVRFTMENYGQNDASGVAVCSLSIHGNTSAVTWSAGPAPAVADIAAGASVDYEWTYAAVSAGTVEFSGCGNGTDAWSGRPVSTASVTSPALTVQTEVQRIATDPFGDGTSFAYVFAHAGYVYLGPRASGGGAVRFLADGSGGQSVSFALPADVLGTMTQNSSPAPYPSIGKTGCAANTHQCGPDNENGRGLFASAFMNGAQWLVIGGARPGQEIQYIYMSTDTDAAIDFLYVDLDKFLGGNTEGFSAMHVFNNRLYLGFPDTGGSRPYLITLFTTPSAPGLEAEEDLHGWRLGAHSMPGLKVSSPNVAMIDTLIDFNDRLYLANRGNWIRSTNNLPWSYDQRSEDWTVITPSSAAYSAKTSRATSKTAELVPADKAVPQMAAYRGRFYAARNTTAGPQLWACHTATTGSASDCDPGDWSLIAANTTGDTALSQFNNPANTSISFLAATSAHLYVGLDNPGGVTVFRSSAANPTSRADFVGRAGCSAADHPSSCQGLGGPGLGDAGNTTILDGKALALSPEAVYVTAGNGARPVAVYRILQ